MSPAARSVLAACSLCAMLSGPAIAREQGATPASVQTPSPPVPADPPVAPSVAHVTYLTGSSVYLDAGLEEGLQEGDPVEVMRQGQVIATLRVTFISAHRASCSIIDSSAPVAVGDLVRYFPHPKPPQRVVEAPSATPTPREEAGSTRRPGAGPHGRIGARYLVVKDRTGGDNGFSQPALDVRVDWLDLGSGSIDLGLDVRTRRTYRTITDGTTGAQTQNRLYRASVAFQPTGSAQRLTFGRQFSPAIASLSTFDGVLYEYDGSRSGAGLFVGVQPDDVDFGFSTDIREAGAFYRLRGPIGAQRRWNVTTGAVSSHTEGEVNRQFLYLQGQYTGLRLSTYVAQEVDYNTGWKEEAGEDTISPTSTYANVRLRGAEWLTLYGGYDNRRNVRLYRDRVTPATEFDDSMRQGYWSGAALRFGAHVTASADARLSDGGPSGAAQSYGASVGLERFTRANLGFRARSTQYSNDSSEGWLHSLSAGMELGARWHVDLSGGRLDETNQIDPSLDRQSDWYGLDLDILLGRHVYLLLSVERYEGTLEANDQGYASLTYRF